MKYTQLSYPALFLIRCYRYFISPLLGNHCRFYPSCSAYGEQAIRQYGILKGGFLTLKRLGKCHPFSHGGYDPVPECGNSSIKYHSKHKKEVN